jgi:hypothetical protein
MGARANLHQARSPPCVFDHIQGRGQALGFGSVEELGSSQQKRLSMKRATAIDGA